MFDRLRKMRIAGIEAELDTLASKASETGEVTADQARAAAQLVVESRDFGADNILRELDKLCLQYDTVRRTMPSGSGRTQEMTRILVKMRALGPSVSTKIEAYKSSESPGSRLAAVAMMQMEPGRADIDWLLERFRIEAPFIFYHAALALTNAANTRTVDERVQVVQAAKTALKLVRSFEGIPDKGTVDVLEALTRR